MDTASTPTISTSAYTPSGFRIYYSIPVEKPEDMPAMALKLTGMLTAAGMLVNAPGLEAGEEKEIIVTVMRRAKPSDNTPIIDMYPAWGHGEGEPYGTYKYLRVYLNTPEDISAFLNASGLKSLEQIPLYESETALKRKAGKRHNKEVNVPTPFTVVRHKPGKDTVNPDGSTISAAWELKRYDNIANQPASQNAPATPPASAQTHAPAQNVQTPERTSDAPNEASSANSDATTVTTWKYDRNALRTAMANLPIGRGRSSAERDNTIDSMFRNGDFNDVGSLEGAIAKVTNRFMAHDAKRKNKQPEAEPTPKQTKMEGLPSEIPF